MRRVPFVPLFCTPHFSSTKPIYNSMINNPLRKINQLLTVAYYLLIKPNYSKTAGFFKKLVIVSVGCGTSCCEAVCPIK